ncbi:peroxisomal biogenesis factor 11c [Augochlora pura]
MDIELLSRYLETYSGRDKLLKTLSYMAKLATLGTTSKETEKKFKILSSQLSACRVTLRLLDDIPVIHYAMSYGWGKKEPDWLLRLTELLQIGVDIIFCPVEHVCWAAEHKLININVEKWDIASTWFWIISLHLSLIKSMRKLKKLNNRRTQFAVAKQKNNELLTSFRIILDISYAVNYLPPSLLWGGQLKTWQVGALGTLSSLISLYQVLSRLSERRTYS